jgi:hypothetical protein
LRWIFRFVVCDWFSLWFVAHLCLC